MKLCKVLILPLVMSSLMLSSCKNKTPVVNLIYGNMQEGMIEIDYSELSTLVKDEQSFLLAITSSSLGCGCWSTFKNQVLAKYIKDNHVLVYYINHNEFYDASHKLLNTFGLEINNDPGFGIFNNGELAYSEKYSSKNYVFSKPEYFDEYMETKVTLPNMFYVSLEQLDSLYLGNEEFNVCFARSNCGDCQYLMNNFLKEYGLKRTNEDKPLYILDAERVIVKKGNSIYPLREYDEEGNLTELSLTRWNAFKDEYGLSAVNNINYGYNTGYVPTFFNVVPDGVSKTSTIKAGAVYFNDTLIKSNDKYIVDDSYYTNERLSKLEYAKDVKNNVLKGLEINKDDITEYGEYLSWNHDAAEKYHNNLLKAFLDYYLK